MRILKNNIKNNIRGLYSAQKKIFYLFVIALFIIHSLSFAQFSPVMTSSTQEIHTFLTQGGGTTNAKLVFVDLSVPDTTKDLCYIDFSEDVAAPVVHTIAAVEDAHVPVISPDGNWVIYAVGEGAETGSTPSKRSSVYVCAIAEDAVPVLVAADSACEPRCAYAADILTIIYPTLAPNLAWEGQGKTMKVEVDVSSGTPVIGTPEVLFEYGSYTGGLSWDERYLCGGGMEIVMLDLTSGRTRPDTVSSFAQSCNASISSSRRFTNTMMHLTLIGNHPLINGNKTWSSWQTILINNSKGEILQGYWYPTEYKFPLQTDPETFTEGYARWHHCEWSNHPYFAAATLNADRFFPGGDPYFNTYYQERLYLINLKDSAYIEVLHPDTILYNGTPGDNSGFHWPYLWVEIPDGFIEDSTWLDPVITPINSHHGIPSHTLEPCILYLKNNRILSSQPISSLLIYQIDGSCLVNLKLHNNERSINLESIDHLRPGVYLFTVKTVHNIQKSFQGVFIY